MKSRSIGTKLGMAALCLVVLGYFGLQVWRYYADPLTTTAAYPYQVEKSCAAAGYLIREEQVLPDSGSGLLQLSRAEGERVSKGGALAVIYPDQASLDRQTEINALTTRIEQLTYAKESAASGDVTLKVDGQIRDSILAVNRSVTADRLAGAEGEIAKLRSLVLKRDYTTSGTEDLTAELKELEKQRSALQSGASGSAKRITAPASGIYSAVVDGYESVLTPAFLQSLTPSALSGIEPESGSTSRVGKLITGDTWYYAATLAASDAEQLQPGRQVTLRFAKGAVRDLPAKVESISAPEGGRVAIVLSGRSYLSELTLLRKQSVDLITDAVEGLRVPESALRVETVTETDPETGAESSVTTTGVYCMVGMVARFKPVKVLYIGDGFALVKAASDADRTLLRAGDEIILTANDLYDGKTIR